MCCKPSSDGSDFRDRRVVVVAVVAREFIRDLAWDGTRDEPSVPGVEIREALGPDFAAVCVMMSLETLGWGWRWGWGWLCRDLDDAGCRCVPRDTSADFKRRFQAISACFVPEEVAGR